LVNWDIINIRITQNLSNIYIDRLFKRALASFDDKGWPLIDIYEFPDEIIVTVELPGAKKEEVEILIKSNKLIIKGIKRIKKYEGKLRCHMLERKSGPFQRVLVLPKKIDQNSVTATYNDGILEIRLKIKSPVRREVQID